VSDGSEAGTQRVRELPPETSPMEMVAFGDRVLLSASSDTSAGVWVSDGTSAGTQRIHDGQAFSLGVLGDRAYFASGASLHATDGTEQGTGVVATFATTLRWLRTMSGLVMMNADDGSGEEPFLFDPQAQAAAPIADVWPGPQSSQPWAFAAAGDLVFFNANDGVHGFEPWVYQRRR
jgi:ELWxxDGT repeat protein